MDNKRLYWLWDYDLTGKQVREILAGKNETEKIWMTGRILSSAHFKDVWRYLSIKDILNIFPKLQVRPEVKDNWQQALTVWGYHVPTAQ